jgi:DNA-binding response OmpR family regulator
MGVPWLGLPTSRILIAEDNHEIRSLVCRVLAHEGYEVESVADGEKAIERISSDHFDAIVLDFMMPLKSGFDVIQWIEANRPDVASSCVIVLTAAVFSLKTFDRATVYAAIPKPFDIDDLRNTVRQCVEKRSRT